MIQSTLENLPSRIGQLRDTKEVLLANAVMLGEIPAPTFAEEPRIQFLANRFTEEGLQNISIDEAGNAMGILPGSQGDQTVLVLAHADTPFDAATDHAMTVTENRIIGPGIADNSLGLAAMASLPPILEKIGIRLQDNLLLLGVSKSLGQGDLEGLRFFLNNKPMPVRTALCLEGERLGRLSYNSLGTLRGAIRLELPEGYDLSDFGALGAVGHLSEIAHRIQGIPIPRIPRTSIILGSLRTGATFNRVARSGVLRFEATSEDNAQVEAIHRAIAEIVDEVHTSTGAEVELDIVARRNPGGLAYGHPLVKSLRAILKALGTDPKARPSSGDLSALADHGIPAVTLGLTQAENLQEADESVQIEPIYAGLAQVLALLEAIDQGLCDEED
jgi:acetylornithine deacetylase/succinyl-diaminopimelate desuccinylase-like protein